VALFMNIY